MRILLPLALLLVAALAVPRSGAKADEPEATTLEALNRRLDTLEKRSAYLASRERSLTAYILANRERAATFSAALARARSEGFTAGAISSTSREVLLAGLETLAKEILKDLPEPTREEMRLLKAAEER